MRIIVSNQITIKDPPESLIKWCKTELRIKNPEYDTKQRMGFWLGRTPRYLDLYEMRGADLILPYGTLQDLVEQFGVNRLEYHFANADYVDYKADIPLYDYQKEAVEAMYWKHGGILHSPAGSGKTQMAIALIAKYGERALWLTHTKDLLMQSKERAERYIDPSLIGTITEGKVNIGVGITFATVQTMCRLNLSLYKDVWDVIVVDECHRIAGTPTSVTQFSRVLNGLAARHKFGLSATIHRADGLIKSTFALIGDVSYTVPEEAVSDKIVRVGILPIPTGVGISTKCMNPDGTLNYTKLIGYLCENEERNNLILNCIVQNRDKSSLILSDRLEHLHNLIEALPLPMQEYAVMVSGKMTSKKGKEERAQAIEYMRSGKKKYLFATYSLAKEGLDIPCLERLYMATPQKDYAVITQSIGRIARTFPGKQDPVCYDFVDSIRSMEKAYKKRCTTYRKNGCYFVER